MKIKTKLKLIIISIIALLVGIVSMNLWLNVQNKRTNNQRALVEKLSFEVFQSNQIRDEYFVYRSERSKQQWLILSPKIIERFGEMSAEFTDHEERTTIEKIIDLHKNISNLFNQLIGYDQDVGNHNPAGTEMRERIISQMMGLSHLLYLESSKLSKAINKKADQQILFSNTFTAITLGLLGLVIIYFSRVLIQRVTYPLAKLKEGTRVVAEGNFNHRVNIASSDEIGELANDFDIMTEKLQTVTVSRDELGKEIKERMAAEDALITQNKTFSEVLNGLDALVYVIDMKTYEIVFINTYGQNIWGDIKGKICWQTIQAGQAGPCDFCTNSKIVRPDGNPAEVVAWEFQNTVNKRWFDCRDRAIYWPDGRIVRMEIATDITKRKEIEEALRESDDELRWLLRSMMNAFVVFESVFDDDGHFISYRFVYINDAYEFITGVKNDDVKGKTVHEIWPETEPEWIKKYGEVAVTGVSQTFDMYHNSTKKFYHCNVYRPWVTKNRFCVIFEDITDRKRAEEQIQESNEKLIVVNKQLIENQHRLSLSEGLFRGLFDNMTSGAAIYTVINDGSKGSDYIIKSFNKTSLEIEGKTLADVVGRSLFDLRPTIDNYGLIPVLKRVWETWEPAFFPAKVYQDEHFSNYYENYVFKIPSGEVVTIYNDVTVNKRAEAQIKASLLEKETMLKEIHHRVKNNLQVISSLLDLQSSYLQDEKAKEMLRNSMDRVRTMAMIHTQLYQSQDLARVDFGSFIRDLIGNISQSYGMAESPVEIHVDAGEINLGIDASIPCGLILNELVSNALKHAFPEGKEGEINIRMRLKDSRVALTVQDNGIGFPESIDLTNLKSLGLELVNILVGQMNGKMDMQVDGGTTWTITFPVKNEREWRDG